MGNWCAGVTHKYSNHLTLYLCIFVNSEKCPANVFFLKIDHNKFMPEEIFLCFFWFPGHHHCVTHERCVMCAVRTSCISRGAGALTSFPWLQTLDLLHALSSDGPIQLHNTQLNFPWDVIRIHGVHATIFHIIWYKPQASKLIGAGAYKGRVGKVVPLPFL